MNQRKRLGAWSSFAVRPLIEGLSNGNALDLQHYVPAHAALMIREHDLDIALLSPLDYAKESSELVIVPEFALWSETGGNAVTVHFRSDLHDVETLAVDPSSASEIVLAKIILGEEFDVEPRIVPVQGSLEEMLERADAALLVGDAALREAHAHGDALDIVEAWVQLTSAPYVHGFWCARESDLDTKIVERLLEARRDGVAAFSPLAAKVSATRDFPGFGQEDLLDYLERFSYDFPEEAVDGIKEFHHYAYYHGILQDIPEVVVYGH